MAISPPRRSSNASADGYTLLAVSPGAAINGALYDKLNFDFLRDIAPVAGILRVANVMAVSLPLPVKTVPEFIAYAKANPNKINMAIGRHRLLQSPVGRAVQADERRADAACALSRRRARVDRPHRRTGAGGLLRRAVDGRIHQGRQGARARRHVDVTRGGPAERSHGRRIRTRLRGEQLVGHRRAEEHARCNRRQAQPGDQRRVRRSQDEGAACGAWRRRACGPARRLREADRRRNRKMGKA